MSADLETDLRRVVYCVGNSMFVFPVPILHGSLPTGHLHPTAGWVSSSPAPRACFCPSCTLYFTPHFSTHFVFKDKFTFFLFTKGKIACILNDSLNLSFMKSSRLPQHLRSFLYTYRLFIHEHLSSLGTLLPMVSMFPTRGFQQRSLICALWNPWGWPGDCSLARMVVT